MQKKIKSLQSEKNTIIQGLKELSPAMRQYALSELKNIEFEIQLLIGKRVVNQTVGRSPLQQA